MVDELATIHAALEAGDKRGARRLLKPLLDTNPSAELWWLAACTCESEEQEIGCLRKALKIDSKHAQARGRYTELRRARHDDMMPPLETLVDDLPPLELLTDFPALIRERPGVDIQAIKTSKRRRHNRRWSVVGCGGSILMSLSLGYFVMTVLGSPVAAQIRTFLSGEAPAGPSNVQPIFGQPDIIATTQADDPGNPSRPSDVTVDSDGGQQSNSDAPRPTPDNNPQTYADDAASGGFQVRPNKSAPIAQGSPATDVLDPGFAHEYTFNTTSGQEFAIAIQFFSPTATSVSANVAIVDGDGVNAESHCERDTIFVDGSGIAFICQVHKGGNWKLQVFGRDGQSTGVYVVTYDGL
jgi:hypothetical protein